MARWVYRPDNDKEAAFGCGCFLVWILLVLSFWAAIIYVACHFIGKFW
jgi:hypothetical protein